MKNIKESVVNFAKTPTAQLFIKMIGMIIQAILVATVYIVITAIAHMLVAMVVGLFKKDETVA